MTIQEKLDETVRLYGEIAKIWGTPSPVMEAIHFVDPRLFHMLPKEDISVMGSIQSVSVDMAHVVATIDAGEMFLRLYCGHNDECPMITRE